MTRALSHEKGNILLIGSAGVGKTSMSRMSSFLLGMTTFEIDFLKLSNPNNWKDELRKLLK
jgi:hypothetical protein